MKQFTQYFLIFIFAGLVYSCSNQRKKRDEISEIKYKTVCNPMDLSYRFMPGQPSRREAADPSVIFFKDKYWLFASKSGGYWYSDDLKEWNFVQSDEIPTEQYAPTAVVLNDTVFFLASSRIKCTIYKSADPMSGKWDIAKDTLQVPVWDPAFFLDDDDRLYLFHGCSPEKPIFGVELDPINFSFIGERHELINTNPDKFGWEVRGDYNDKYDEKVWMEGAYVNKHKGKYYLQYAVPATQEKSYNDGVYISDYPLGPYKLAEHNPFAYKPEGYACGAGHGSTFKDKYGNYWHLGTVTVSVKNRFERRLSFFPVFFDDAGIIYATTKYGDYPMIIPKKKIKSHKDIFPEWMLLSYKKKVSVSSTLHDSLSADNMTDESIKTYWSAKSGNASEFVVLDLGKNYDVYAIQINFAEHNTQILNRQAGLRHRYTLEVSSDNKTWEVQIDKSNNSNDNSHDYTQLEEKKNCRYLRLKNIEVPDGTFALSGFRVFGKGNGAKPSTVSGLKVKRNETDKRMVQLAWDKVENVTGYNISYGIAENKLYHNYIVYDTNQVQINSLNAELKYYFKVEAFNENGFISK